MDLGEKIVRLSPSLPIVYTMIWQLEMQGFDSYFINVVVGPVLTQISLEGLGPLSIVIINPDSNVHLLCAIPPSV